MTFPARFPSLHGIMSRHPRFIPEEGSLVEVTCRTINPHPGPGAPSLGHGACWLGDPRIARLVEEALLHFDGKRYRLIAWCVMPNHVHALVETREEWPLAGIVHSWKSFTAHRANRILKRSGDFWLREYFDRFIRDDRHFENAVGYIEINPKTTSGMRPTTRCSGGTRPKRSSPKLWRKGRLPGVSGVERGCERSGVGAAWWRNKRG